MAIQRELTGAVENAYEQQVLGHNLPNIPIASVSTLGERRETVGKTYSEFNVYSALASAEKTYMALNQNVVCPMLMVSNSGCYIQACYLIAAAQGAFNQNWYQKAMYVGEILELKDSEIDVLNSAGGLRLNGAGDITSWTQQQMRDIIKHAGMRGLKIKIITKQEQAFAVTAEVLRDLGDQAADVQIQPTIDPYWIPVTADDIVGSPLEGYADMIKKLDAAGDTEGLQFLFDQAAAHYSASSRQTRMMPLNGKPMLWRKWGFSFERVAALVKKHPELEGKIQPRTTVMTAQEIVYYLKEHPEAISTWMHGSVPPGVVYSDIHKGILQEPDIGNWPGEHLLEKGDDGRWQIKLVKSEDDIKETRWTKAVVVTMSRSASPRRVTSRVTSGHEHGPRPFRRPHPSRCRAGPDPGPAGSGLVQAWVSGTLHRRTPLDKPRTIGIGVSHTQPCLTIVAH